MRQLHWPAISGSGNLVFLYDDNQITIDGSTELSFTEDVPARFKAYGWHTITVDGHNREEIRSALSVARTVTDKPVLISCKNPDRLRKSGQGRYLGSAWSTPRNR